LAASSYPEVKTRLDVGPLQKQTLKASMRQKVTQQIETPRKAQEMSPRQLASVLFDMACIAYGQKNEALALTITEQMGDTVSGSLVGRWRSAEAREIPSTAQILALGPEFGRLYQKAHTKHFGWGRRALLDLAAALGEVASQQE
jgi:hypothetical protein